jgi:hypothetical protein
VTPVFLTKRVKNQETGEYTGEDTFKDPVDKAQAYAINEHNFRRLYKAILKDEALPKVRLYDLRAGHPFLRHLEMNADELKRLGFEWNRSSDYIKDNDNPLEKAGRIWKKEGFQWREYRTFAVQQVNKAAPAPSASAPAVAPAATPTAAPAVPAVPAAPAVPAVPAAPAVPAPSAVPAAPAVPAPSAAAPPTAALVAPAPPTEFVVQLPPGAVAGQRMMITSPITRQQMTVVVPQGVSSNGQLTVRAQGAVSQQNA